MKKNREELENNFNIILQEVNNNRSCTANISKILFGKNISNAKRILNGNITVETLDLDIIYIVLKTIYKETSINMSNPEIYFTDIEIKELEKVKIENTVISYPLTFKDVKKINDQHFALFIDIKELVNLYNNNMIIYNFDTQRNKKVRKYGNKIIESVNLNKNSVREIGELMSKNEYFPNFITINLLQDGEDEFYYNEKDKTFVINNGELNILDGFHRLTAMSNVLEENPNLNLMFGLYITNFDVDKARRYIIQEDKKNKINSNYIKSIDNDNLVNKVVTKINESSNSDLRGKIVDEQHIINAGIGLVISSTLRSTIEKCFEIQTRKDVQDISEFLIDGYNYIIGSYPDKFINKVKIEKEKTIHAYSNTFIIYTTLLSKLYGKEDWAKQLNEKLKNLDFNISNKKWEELKILEPQYKINNKVIENIIKYISEVI